MSITKTDNKGFTLIEVVIAIVIVAILATVAMRSALFISETAKEEETKQELELLQFAIVGNPLLFNDNTRSDFGYVGDIGAMPPNLDALFSNPGGYATWNGPYVKRRFEQDVDGYKQDAWGVTYTYSGNSVTSTGSSTNIVREFGTSVSDFLMNGVEGVLLDLDGTPPGTVYRDSITISMTHPNGSGGYTTQVTQPDLGGFFNFESVPIGNHDIELVYNPTNDSLKRFVSIVPNSRHYGEYFLSQNVWYDTTSGGGGGGGSGDIEYVTNSDTLYSSCENLRFWITNNSGNPVSVTSIRLTWSSPTAYYEKVKWNGNQVVDAFPRVASGQAANFSGSQTINNAQTLLIEIEAFKDNPASGGSVDMTNTVFTVEFSDGSTFSFTADYCG